MRASRKRGIVADLHVENGLIDPARDLLGVELGGQQEPPDVHGRQVLGVVDAHLREARLVPGAYAQQIAEGELPALRLSGGDQPVSHLGQPVQALGGEDADGEGHGGGPGRLSAGVGGLGGLSEDDGGGDEDDGHRDQHAHDGGAVHLGLEVEGVVAAHQLLDGEDTGA
jgi:hypothetical protein